MAEGLLKKMFSERLGETSKQFSVISAGHNACIGCAPVEAIQVMRDEGVNLSDFQSSQLTPDMVKQSDLILTMKRSHKSRVLMMNPIAKRKVFTLKEFAGETQNFDIDDPYGRGIEAYKICADEIKRSLNKAFDKIVTLKV
jgi:protein-tyrosine-phosphatase